MRADLHLHTTASDGMLSPQEIVREASNIGLDIIAITDHDSVKGIPLALEAAKLTPQFLVIPGVEINTDAAQGEVHILGYFIDYRDTGLNQTLEELRTSRYERGQRMVAKLADTGIDIEWTRVLELAGEGCVGRPHIALAILESGYISSIREAFDRYIGRNCIAYVERKKLTPLEAVSLVRESGGAPFLAHPAGIANLEYLIRQLMTAGMIGIEVYYSSYYQRTIENLQRLADKYNLISSGGSDYHGFDDTIGADIGSITLPQKSIDEFIYLAKQKGKVISQC